MNDLKAVVMAQEYIKAHHSDDGFCLEAVCKAVGYSRRQLDRFFEKYMKTTLREYINAVVLSESTERLLSAGGSVLDAAFDSHYQSHEGYTRAFAKRFSITPKEYRKRQIAIPIFTQHPANHYFMMKEGQTMDTADRKENSFIWLQRRQPTTFPIARRLAAIGRDCWAV